MKRLNFTILSVRGINKSKLKCINSKTFVSRFCTYERECTYTEHDPAAGYRAIPLFFVQLGVPVVIRDDDDDGDDAGRNARWKEPRRGKGSVRVGGSRRKGGGEGERDRYAPQRRDRM